MKRSLLLLSWLLLPAVPWGCAQKLTIDDLLNAGSAGRRGEGEGVRSPDGRYLLTAKNEELALRAVDGGEPKVLDASPGMKSELAWSHDSSRIAYISQGNVWEVAASGGGARQITHDPKGPGDPRGATDHHPQWNPNGRWILYESGQKGYNELYAVSEDGAVKALLAATEIYHGSDAIAVNVARDGGDAVSSDRFDASPKWSPDGTRISYTERSREFFSGKLKVLGFDQKSGQSIEPARDLYVAQSDPGGAWAVNTAAWSPDSSTLAVVLQETHWDKIWLIPAKGGKPKELTFGNGEDEDPLYSPDGRWIVYVSNRDHAEERHLWIVKATGGSPRRLTALDGIEGEPEWSTDGQSITFTVRTKLGATAKYSAGIAGNNGPKLLGVVHHSRLEDLGIVPEVVHYKSKDGLRLAGILYKPAGFRPGIRYPAVILAHGGPEGQVQLSVAPWSIFLAEHGYVVLEPNFRGSTGYGERFRNANVEDSGGGEIDDIGASAKFLVDSGLTDAKRIGISGGSHGGTVVANAVTKLPDTFAVGIEKYGVVDRALFLRYTNRNSAIRWETKMGGPPEKKAAVYRKANVLPDVARVKAPLLILHGEADPQVPPQESQELVAALKKEGKTYSYFTYPGEGHGFQQRDHRKDAYERELAYLDKYLKTDEAAPTAAGH